MASFCDVEMKRRGEFNLLHTFTTNQRTSSLSIKPSSFKSHAWNVFSGPSCITLSVLLSEFSLNFLRFANSIRRSHSSSSKKSSISDRAKQSLETQEYAFCDEKK